MAFKVHLGVLRGYNSTSDAGNFNLYLCYDSADRDKDGNSTSVTFKNCYI